MSANLRTICLSLAVLLAGTCSPFAAEYNGQNIDGVVYDAEAFSYETSKYYNVSVEFDGDEAIIFFHNGGHIRVTLDDEEIDDPHSISAFDYNRSIYWDLDVDGLD
jgi:hypothetical protein